MPEHVLPPVAVPAKRRDLRITYRDRLGWIVIDKTVLNPCAESGVPVYFAAPAVDLCYAWLSRQETGAPEGALTIRKTEVGWRVADGRDRSYALAKTRALALDCARVIRDNPAPLVGEWT